MELLISDLGGNNVYIINAQSGGGVQIMRGWGVNDLVLANIAQGTTPTVDWPNITQTAGCSISYTSSSSSPPQSTSLLTNGAGSNTLTLDTGGPVSGLGILQANTNLVIANGTTLDICGQNLNLAGLTLVNGSIVHSVGTGSINAGEFNLQNGSISPNLLGGVLTMNDGYAALLGNDIFSSVTITSGTLAGLLRRPGPMPDRLPRHGNAPGTGQPVAHVCPDHHHAQRREPQRNR